jgi:hypothetical protein
MMILRLHVITHLHTQYASDFLALQVRIYILNRLV